MPSCNFYGTLTDHVSLLTWIFAENVCLVHEVTSDDEQLPQRFVSAEEVTLQFERRLPNGQARSTVDICLYVLGSGPPAPVRRIELDPKATDGAEFRFQSVGWGLIYLHLSVPERGRFLNSDTNHNTAKRARKWARTDEEIAQVDLWDFQKVSTFSSRLIRQIRTRSVGKLGRGTAVLPGALECWQRGVSLDPFVPGQHVLEPK